MARLTLSSETKDLLESKSGPFFACHGWPCRKFMQILTMYFNNHVELYLGFFQSFLMKTTYQWLKEKDWWNI